MRPLEVEISFNNQPMSADRKYEIECQAIGSRPPAKITWWMENMELLAHQKVFFMLAKIHQIKIKRSFCFF